MLNCKLNHNCKLIHRDRDEMGDICQATHLSVFSSLQKLILWQNNRWRLFLWVQLAINQHWFRQWLGAEQAISHYLNQWSPSLPTHICVTRPQWVNDISHFDISFSVGTILKICRIGNLDCFMIQYDTFQDLTKARRHYIAIHNLSVACNLSCIIAALPVKPIAIWHLEYRRNVTCWVLSYHFSHTWCQFSPLHINQGYGALIDSIRVCFCR